MTYGLQDGGDFGRGHFVDARGGSGHPGFKPGAGCRGGSGAGEEAEDSKPEWLTAALPAVAMADSPECLAWKKFAPRTKVTYVSRLLRENQPGTNAYTSMDMASTTYAVKSINEKQAVVEISGTTFRVSPQHPKTPDVVPSAPFERIYLAKQPIPASPVAAPNESGDAELEISGKKFATHWTSVWGHMHGPPYTPDPMEFTKTWMSDEVPGGLVRMLVQSNVPVTTRDGPKPNRSIKETIVQPVEGVAPRVGGKATTQPLAAPASQAAVKVPVTPAVVRPGPVPVAGVTPGEKYRVVAARVRQVKLDMTRAGLIAGRGRLATPPKDAPDDVKDARDRLDAETKAVVASMSGGDPAKFDESLKTLEETLDVLEGYLKK